MMVMRMPVRGAVIAAALSMTLMSLGGAAEVRAQAESCSTDACARERAATQRQRELDRLRGQMERALRMLATEGDSVDPAMLAQLRRNLTDVMRQLEVARLRMEAAEARGSEERAVERIRRYRVAQTPQAVVMGPEPRGWIGISFSASIDAEVGDDGETIWSFRGYPVVESVEPASPARRAGIEVGDVLLAFGGRDLARDPIPRDELLTPGKRIRVKLRRQNDVKTLNVTVADAPRRMTVMVTPELAPLPPAASVAAAPRVPPVAAPPAPNPVPQIIFFGGETVALAGAELMSVRSLPENARGEIGAHNGLMILRVGPGTPAARAGLQRGDVIIAIAGDDVTSFRDLQSAFAAAQARKTLALKIIRDREMKAVALKW